MRGGGLARRSVRSSIWCVAMCRVANDWGLCVHPVSCQRRGCEWGANRENDRAEWLGVTVSRCEHTAITDEVDRSYRMVEDYAATPCDRWCGLYIWCVCVCVCLCVWGV